MNSVWYLRKKMNMTQSEFSEFCDVSVVSISRYENGSNISRKNAENIAKSCHVSVDVVLNAPEASQSDRQDKQENAYFMLASDEEKILTDYRRLNKRGRYRVRETLDEMLRLYSS